MIKFKNKEAAFIILAISIGLILRIWRLPTDLLTHFDQGLHALGSWRIWHDHEFKLLGQQTDTDGIFHGPLYYLMMSIPYALSGGSPAAASLFQILLEAFSLTFFYLAIRNLFNKKTAMVSLIIYAISFGMIGYSRWLSNVTPSLPFSIFLLYLISLPYSKKSSARLFLAGLLVGIVAQMNGAVGFGLIITYFFVQKKYYSPKFFFLTLLGILTPAIPQIIFEFRHQFVITKAILHFFTDPQSGGVSFQLSLIPNIKTYFKEINHIISYKYVWLSAPLFVLSLLKIAKHSSRRLFLGYLVIPILTFSLFKRGAISFFFIYTFPVAIAVVANFITKLPRLLFYFFLVLILSINLYHARVLRSPTNALTPIGNSNIITLQDRKNIIDWMYAKANGHNFAIWFYTIPYYQEEVWDYMFLWYAQSTYLYQPEATKDFSPNELKYADTFFNVYEPDKDFDPGRQVRWFREVEKNFGPVIDSYSSHDLTVELRAWKGN